MTGREDKKANDLFFTCALVEYIARKTKNKPVDIVNFLGKKNLEKIYVIDILEKVYNSPVSDLIEDYNGSFYYENPQTICETYKTNVVC